MTIPEYIYVAVGSVEDIIADIIKDMDDEQARQVRRPFQHSFATNACEDSPPHQPRRSVRRSIPLSRRDFFEDERSTLRRGAWSRQDSSSTLRPPVRPRRSNDADETKVIAAKHALQGEGDETFTAVCNEKQRPELQRYLSGLSNKSGAPRKPRRRRSIHAPSA